MHGSDDTATGVHAATRVRYSKPKNAGSAGALVTTPTLLLHGINDRTDTKPQSMKFFTAIRDQGVGQAGGGVTGYVRPSRCSGAVTDRKLCGGHAGPVPNPGR